MRAVKWLVDELTDNGVQHLDLAHEIIEKAEELEQQQMLAPLEAAIKKFEEARDKSETLKDTVYLVGVLAVLDTVKAEFSNPKPDDVG